jgi:hypothetical protein
VGTHLPSSKAVLVHVHKRAPATNNTTPPGDPVTLYLVWGDDTGVLSVFALSAHVDTKLVCAHASRETHLFIESR